MWKKYIYLFCSLIFSFQTLATEVLVWDKTPLKIHLNVGKERIVEFPDNVRYGLPRDLENKVSITSAAGVLYITAKEAFPETRINVQYIENNRLVFIDLFATGNNDDDLEPIKVINVEDTQNDEKQSTEEFKKTSGITVKQLFQFASRDFYAPSRLKMHNIGVQEKRITKPLNLDFLFMNNSAGLFELKALKQYRTTKYTLTAIKLTNSTLTTQPIIKRDIYPDYIVVASQHSYVGPKNSPTDTTILYLITKDPLTNNGVYTR